ncbi:carboxypeptidase M32 [Thermoflavimicrobium dichotomicum]|uniref:Metal-dependent carboxypeptidase n=1 Tax=Thermoflavimicrobium dichotomicum TaxID=46223 RepID=A0A1I3JK08_9BACL|nr:carboxypeptidase Taq [Thermoflavimicrobium dichotomicum]
MEKKFEELKKRLHEIYYLQSVMSVLTWDQNTYLPPAGANARGSHFAVLGKIAHEKQTDPKLGKLIEELIPWTKNLPYDSDEAALVRLAKREYEKAVRLPTPFVAELNEHLAKTYQVWVEARAENQFAKVEPYLEKTLELSRAYAEFFPGYEHIADPLIAESDYGMKASAIRKIFRELREELVPLVEQVTSQPEADLSFLHQHYPKERQLEFSRYIAGRLGLDQKRARIDLSPHPFMIRFSHGDIRITTRVDEQNLADCLFSVIHETGHALYELGIDPSYEGTPLYDGISSGVHESQSRLWENIVGRSRDFWEYFYPQLQAVFPAQLSQVSLDEFYRGINHVKRSLIRTEADELTYNLHVIIRFELELALLEGELRIKDLPEAWRSRYQSDLGVTPPDEKRGVLQDVHWYAGLIGGAFQGYTLGNILSAQFFEAALKAHPDIPNQIKQGNFTTLHDWLKENIYRYGSKYTAEEIVQRATGSSLTIQPYMNYLRKKYKELYRIT